MNNESKWVIGVVVAVLALCCCLGIICVLSGGLALFSLETISRVDEPQVIVETLVSPDFPRFTTPTVIAPGMEEQEPPDSDAYETLLTLEEEVVPINDPRDLAERLGGKIDVPETFPAESANLQLGAEQQFWATNIDNNQNFQVTATLQYVTDHLYFWIENGVRFNKSDLRELAETFENEIYPTNRAFFGSEWSPGVDHDPHLYVLYSGGLGSGIAGYFSSADEVHPLAHQYSNAHEMFMINSDNVSLGEEYIYSTMAHEFQHMIHWYRDRNEESWMNEGFSVLSEILNGFDVGGFDYLYVMDPDIQLTHWPDSPNSSPHYGASFLFLAYFLDRFGEEATQALVAHPENGMISIDAVLQELDLADPLNGRAITADDVFVDWVVTTYLNDPAVEDGRFAYQRYSQAPQAGDTEVVDDCPMDWETRTVKQFGVDYISIQCQGNLSLSFEGSTQVNVSPVDAYAGDYAFWSNKGDESDMTLTRSFDFSAESGPLTLTYRTWYDLETDYDYLYLVASEDGENWQILTTPSGTAENPSGNSYGWGYNGDSGGWIEEEVDLSRFAGKEIQLRFEYVTDAAVNGEGLLLDEISIPEIGYKTGFEEGDDDWIGEGFVRIQNQLPQIFNLSLIKFGDDVTVERVMLDDQQRANIDLDMSGDVNDVVLVVSGMTRFTIQPATYRFSIE